MDISDFGHLKSYAVAFLAGVTLASVVWVFVVKPVSSSSSLSSSSSDTSLQKVQGTKTDAPLAQIVVDVSGAVKTPGVYKLSTGARIGDALVAAGGVDLVQADHTYLSQKINLAAAVTDGQKIYLPFTGETYTTPAAVVLGSVSSLVSINSGSAGELDTLPGVGPATAAKIIDSRPYGSLEDLVGKKAVGQSEFEKIKDKISL